MEGSSESVTDVAREYIDLVNGQVGVYMDALAGFAGHATRVERQIARALRPDQRSDPSAKESVMAWTSYEDSSSPKVIHTRIIRAVDYVAINARGGSNEHQHARGVLVFLFTAWELDIRPRLARAANLPLNEIKSNIMGDLRLIRHAILHAKNVLASDKHRGLRELSEMFAAGQPIAPSYEDMHRVFVLVKQDCARQMVELLNLPTQGIDLASVQSVAIHRRRPVRSEQ